MENKTKFEIKNKIVEIIKDIEQNIHDNIFYIEEYTIYAPFIKQINIVFDYNTIFINELGYNGEYEINLNELYTEELIDILKFIKQYRKNILKYYKKIKEYSNKIINNKI